MIGRTYLERGQPVTVLIRSRWSAPPPAPAVPWIVWLRPPRRTAPRSVLIQRADGTKVVRGFRGLRKPKETADD